MGILIFVVHHQNGRISVLDALSPHVLSGISSLLAWCPEARVFTDLAYGSRFDEWGVHGAGPAPSSMTAFSWERVSTFGLRVTGVVGPAGPRAGADLAPVDWGRCHYTMHRLERTAALTPAKAAALPGGVWVALQGRLDLEGRRMCGSGLSASDPRRWHHHRAHGSGFHALHPLDAANHRWSRRSRGPRGIHGRLIQDGSSILRR